MLAGGWETGGGSGIRNAGRGGPKGTVCSRFLGEYDNIIHDPRACGGGPLGILLDMGARERGVTVWLTGLSGAGKTTTARVLEGELRSRGCRVEVLDGDEVRKNLTRGLGFSKEDRDENIRRLGYVAGLLTRNGVVVIVSVISPYRQVRGEVRAAIGDFIEVYVSTPIEVCEKRDVKGLYRKARSGELKGFTGIDDPYEPPEKPEVVVDTTDAPVEAGARAVIRRLEQDGYV